MKKMIKGCLMAAGIWTVSLGAQAQLSTNPDKFLGNITTWNSMDTDGFIFADYWNQVTPENATKWQSVEGNRHGTSNWGDADKAYKYAKEHGFPFKFHTLVWVRSIQTGSTTSRRRSNTKPSSSGWPKRRSTILTCP